MKLQSFFGYVSNLKVCELNTDYVIKLYKCPGKTILPNAHQKTFLDM